MKRVISLLSVGLFALCFTFTALAAPGDDKDVKAAVTELNTAARAAMSTAAWDAFSGELVKAFKSDHDGLQHAALRLIIQYGDNLDVHDAVFDVMRIYRDGNDECARRMALVALGHMDSKWAIRFLERSEQFEKSPVLKRTIQAVVASYHQAH